MLILLIGRCCQVVLTVLQLKIATTILDPTQFGAWTLIQSTAAFFILIGISPFGFYLNRYVSAWYAKGILPSVFRTYSMFMLCFSVAIGIIVFFLSWFNIYNVPFIESLFLAFLVSLLMFTQTFHQTWVPTLNFLGNRKSFVLGSIASIFINVCIALSFLYFGLKGIKWWAVSVSFGFIISTFIVVPKEWYKPSKESWTQYVKFSEIFLFSFPLLFSSLFIWFQTQGYRFLLESKIGIDELGRFAAGYAVVMGLYTSVEMIISSYYQSIFFQRLNLGFEFVKELSKVWDMAMLPFLFSGVVLYFSAPDLAYIFLGTQFTENLNWISFIALAEASRVMFNLLSVNFHGKKETKKLIWPQISGVLFTFSAFFLSNALTFHKAIAFIGGGYIIASILLLGSEYKTFRDSLFFKKLGFAMIITCSYALVCYLLSFYTSGVLKLVLIVSFAVPFLLPYLKKNLVGKEYE